MMKGDDIKETETGACTRYARAPISCVSCVRLKLGNKRLSSSSVALVLCFRKMPPNEFGSVNLGDHPVVMLGCRRATCSAPAVVSISVIVGQCLAESVFAS
jgi:hypothetical protein